jgi:hypothetical protein
VVVGAPDVKDTCTVPVAPATRGRLAGLGAHPLTPAPEHTVAAVYVVVAVPVLVIWKSDDESVLGGTLRPSVPSGVTDAAGGTTVSFH